VAREDDKHKIARRGTYHGEKKSKELNAEGSEVL
jgi:hypothetical protein